MPSGPVHDFRVFTPPSFAGWRYNSDRYESVRLPRYGNLASCTSSEQSAQAMELFVVPKSMPRAPLLVLGAREEIWGFLQVGMAGLHECLAVRNPITRT